MRSRLHAGLLAAAGLVAGGLAVATLPAEPAVASDQVCEGIVIDYGTLSGAPSPLAQGAQVAPGTSDLEALNTARDTVEQNDSGLVCTINNQPVNGLANCTATSGSDYYYWSYWQGNPYTNAWTYAEIGPAEHPVSAGQTYVQGWSYQNPGPSGPGATKPSITPAAAFAQGCPGVTPVAPSSGGGSGSGGSGSGSGGSTPTTAAPTPTPTTTATTVATAPAATPSATSGGAHVSGTTTTATRAANGTAPPGTSESTSTTTTALGGSTSSKARTATAKLAASDAGSAGQSGGNPALPIVIVAVLIALLGAAAWFRWRRRPGEE